MRHRVAAGYLLANDTGDGRRWLLLHATKWREWGFPKGHLEPGESPQRAALRECAEECGIATLALSGPPMIAEYVLPNGPAKTVYYFPASTAQTQTTLSHEHDQAAWCTADEVLQRLPYPQLQELFTAHVAGQSWP